MKLTIILTKPPYGDYQAAEAIRHAMGALSDDIEIKLLLVDGGALLSKRGQEEKETGYMNLGESVEDIIDMGGEVLIEKASMKELGLEPENLAEGVNIVSSYELGQAVIESDKTMIF